MNLIISNTSNRHDTGIGIGTDNIRKKPTLKISNSLIQLLTIQMLRIGQVSCSYVTHETCQERLLKSGERKTSNSPNNFSFTNFCGFSKLFLIIFVLMPPDVFRFLSQNEKGTTQNSWGYLCSIN